jgi:hypothetical protein
MLTRIISGGQTGVDRAALDVALAQSFPCGGWCPRGRRAEDGTLPDRYPLVETPRAVYPERTSWNVRDADGTLILLRGEPDRGTRLTIEIARRLGKPCRTVDLSRNPDAAAVEDWIVGNQIAILNVAGPRESKTPGIYEEAVQFLPRLLAKARTN